jgi:hypothetical protein
VVEHICMQETMVLIDGEFFRKGLIELFFLLKREGLRYICGRKANYICVTHRQDEVANPAGCP